MKQYGSLQEIRDALRVEWDLAMQDLLDDARMAEPGQAATVTVEAAPWICEQIRTLSRR